LLTPGAENPTPRDTQHEDHVQPNATGHKGCKERGSQHAPCYHFPPRRLQRPDAAQPPPENAGAPERGNGRQARGTSLSTATRRNQRLTTGQAQVTYKCRRRLRLRRRHGCRTTSTATPHDTQHEQTGTPHSRNTLTRHATQQEHAREPALSPRVLAQRHTTTSQGPAAQDNASAGWASTCARGSCLK
jgi:hypothetical protein